MNSFVLVAPGVIVAFALAPLLPGPGAIARHHAVRPADQR